MLITWLSAMVVLCSGTLAGVLFSVARAVVPTFLALPAGPYIKVHQLLDPRFDPLMPRLTGLSMIASLTLVVLSPTAIAGIAWGTGLVLTAAVALISGLRNVPMNQQVLSWDPASPPANWNRLRTSWGKWNTVRTWCAIWAFAIYIGATFLSQ